MTTKELNTYPKTMTARHFKFGSDTRDHQNEIYALETIVKTPREEAKWYEGLNHEANIVVSTKLSNGVILKQTL